MSLNSVFRVGTWKIGSRAWTNGGEVGVRGHQRGRQVEAGSHTRMVGMGSKNGRLWGIEGELSP